METASETLLRLPENSLFIPLLIAATVLYVLSVVVLLVLLHRSMQKLARRKNSEKQPESFKHKRNTDHPEKSETNADP